MKKYLLLLALCLANSVFSQDLIGKIPTDTPFLMALNGKNINEKVPVKKLKDYPWIKTFFDKEFNDFPDDLSQTGIDFASNQYQYYTNKDSVKCFVILLPIKDKTQFEKLIKNYKGIATSLEFKQEKKYTYATQSKSKFIAWNDKFAVLVTGNYNKSDSDNYAVTEVPTEVSEAVVDTAIVTVDAPAEMNNEVVGTEVVKDAAYEAVEAAATAAGADAMDAVKGDEEQVYPKKLKSTKKKKGSKNKKKSKKGKSRRSQNASGASDETREIVEIVGEKSDEIKYDPDVVYGVATVEDSIQQQKYKEIEIKETEKIKNSATAIFNENFNTSYALNPNSAKISKLIDSKAEAFVWVDVNKITEDIYSGLPRFYKSYKAFSKSGMLDSDYYMNAYFEKEKVRLNQITAPRTEEAKKLLEGVMNSKMDKKLMDYIGNDVMGYYSMATDTEALLKYEYSILRNTLNTIYKTATASKDDNSNNIDVIIDALEIFLDEKAIAGLLPGNAIFVMHDLKSVTKEYTTYEYDENYEKTEKVNSKNELSPEFSFLFSTKNDAFIDKLLKLPLNKKEVKIDYQAENGYYAIHFGKDNVLENLYFGVKNGVVMITTRKQNINSLLQQNPFPIDNTIKNRISKNNAAAWINLQKALLISKTVADSKPKAEPIDHHENNYYDIALKNVNEFSLESKFKKGVFASELIYTIKGNHANSLEYFLNVFDEMVALEAKKKEAIIEKPNEDTKE
jgi:hypothetical protein